MTRHEAQQLINDYCQDIPADEPAAIERLLDHDLEEFSLMGIGCAAGHEQQEVLDCLIYKEGIATLETAS